MSSNKKKQRASQEKTAQSIAVNVDSVPQVEILSAPEVIETPQLAQPTEQPKRQTGIMGFINFIQEAIFGTPDMIEVEAAPSEAVEQPAQAAEAKIDA